MILQIYKVDRTLPEQFIFNALECNNIGDIDPGVYKHVETKEVEFIKVNDLIDAIGSRELIIDKSDIVEMLPDENMLNNDLEIEEQCNYLIMTGLGIERIAIDKEAVFRELSFDALRELFPMR